jgi:hypothetical protein
MTVSLVFHESAGEKAACLFSAHDDSAQRIEAHSIPQLLRFMSVVDRESFVWVLFALLGAVTCALVPPGPDLVSFWAFQEATGQPRAASGPFPYQIHDYNASFPVARVTGGVWGQYAARFEQGQRLWAERDRVPALAGIAGAHAQVSMVAWVQRDSPSWTGGAFVGGVWNEHLAARQYALFINVGACASSGFPQGVNGHISAVGGPTPGSRYCTTAACGSTQLPRVSTTWHCVAMTYDGADIRAYLDGELDAPAGGDAHNPFPYPKGVFDGPGAVANFAVGANIVNETAGAPPILHNFFEGFLGGLAVYNTSLTQAQVEAACNSAPGYNSTPAHSLDA